MRVLLQFRMTTSPHQCVIACYLIDSSHSFIITSRCHNVGASEHQSVITILHHDTTTDLHHKTSTPTQDFPVLISFLITSSHDLSKSNHVLFVVLRFVNMFDTISLQCLTIFEILRKSSFNHYLLILSPMVSFLTCFFSRCIFWHVSAFFLFPMQVNSNADHIFDLVINISTRSHPAIFSYSQMLMILLTYTCKGPDSFDDDNGLTGRHHVIMNMLANRKGNVLRCATGSTRDQINMFPRHVEHTSLNTLLHWIQTQSKTVKSHAIHS